MNHDPTPSTPSSAPSPTRRQVLAAAAGTAATLAAAKLGSAQPATQPATRPRAVPPEMPAVGKASKPIRILILGGTGFIGPHQVQYARARGHKVTIANRGRSRPEMFEGMDVEHLEYDRDQDPAALREAVAAGQKWDLVIDNVGYLPKHTQAACEALEGACGHYAFVSSISVYENRGEGPTEDSPLQQMTDEEAAGATMQDVGKWYGALKVKCEQTAARLMPGRASLVRPGFIVGWGDPTDRFTYWPARVLMEERCGGRMIVPGTREEPAPIQVIDVRDLAQFIVMIGEEDKVGTYNLVGPPEQLPKVVDAAKRHSGAKTEFAFVPMQFLMDNNVAMGAEMPIIIPPQGDYAGFSKTSNAAAVAAGLKPRPIEETTAATIDWWKTLTPQRRALIESERSPAMKPAKEQALLDKWAKEGQKSA